MSGQDRLKALQPVSTGTGGNNRLGRDEEHIDRLLEFCKGLEAGWGIEFRPTKDGKSIRVIANGGGAGGVTTDYGFRVYVAGDGKLKIAAGAAQCFGGEVFAYDEAELANSVGNGGWVYAVCHIDENPPEWDDDIQYDDMDGQHPDTELYVPIAKVEKESGNVKITQMHWGNIVVPAVANAVDIQAELSDDDEEEEGSESGESGGEGGEGNGEQSGSGIVDGNGGT